MKKKMNVYFAICLILFLVTSIPITTATEFTACNLSVSDSLVFGQTFNASNVDSLTVDASDDASTMSKYDYIVSTNPVLWLPLDDNYTDMSGNDNNGTAHGSDIHFNNVKMNNGTVLNGVDDYILVSNSTSLQISDNITYVFNINITAFKRMGFITNNVGSFPLILIRILDDGTFRGVFTSLNGQYVGNYDLDIGLTTGLHHILISYSNGTRKIYLDNILKDSSTNSNMDSIELNTTFNIGRDSRGQDYSNSSFDNLLIYNKILSESERNNLYYDHLQQLRIKTNSNSTWSTEWNSTADNPIQVPYADGEFFSLLNFTVPDSVVQNGITIYDYPSTVQFDAVATVESRLPGTFLYPNSTGSIGGYGRLTSELVYETGINFSDIDTFNLLTPGNMETLSTDDTNYIQSIDKDAAHDGYMYGNFSLPNVESVNFISVKTVHNRVHTNPVILGLFNVSTQKWHAVNNSSVEIIDVELTYNITGTDIIKYTTLVDNTLNLSVSLNTNGDGNYDVFVDYVEIYIDYEETPSITLEYVYNLTISNQNNISILQNDVDDLENNVNNLYLFVLLCTVFLVVTLRKRGDQ